MRNQIFVLTLIFMIIGCKQQTSYQDDAIRYFEINGTKKQYSRAIDQMFELLKNQYSSQNVPNDIWLELTKEKTAALKNILEKLVPAYQSNFNQEEIQQLISFYDSDTGKQAIADQSGLTDKQKEEFAVFLTSDIGKKVQNKSDTLQKMVGQVSESWSSTLYGKMVQKLNEKGFKRP